MVPLVAAEKRGAGLGGGHASGKGGGCVVDEKELNKVMVRGRGRMEGVEGDKGMWCGKGDWLVKINLKDYYLHFDLAEGKEGRGGGWGRGGGKGLGRHVVGLQGSSVWVLEVSRGSSKGVTGDIVRKWRRKY
jgi:hypothetical protein